MDQHVYTHSTHCTLDASDWTLSLYQPSTFLELRVEFWKNVSALGYIHLILVLRGKIDCKHSSELLGFNKHNTMQITLPSPYSFLYFSFNHIFPACVLPSIPVLPINVIMPKFCRILNPIPIPISPRYTMHLLSPTPFPPLSPSSIAILNSTPCPMIRNVVLPRAEIVALRRRPPCPGQWAVVRFRVVWVDLPSRPFFSCRPGPGLRGCPSGLCFGLVDSAHVDVRPFAR